VWAFNYFFYNRKLKRILYLSCRAVTKAAAEASEVGRRNVPAPRLVGVQSTLPA
jgi:hypothetical protein